MVIYIYIARAHPTVGEVTDIATFKTESMMCIKWRPPSSLSCGTTYKYQVRYQYDLHEHYEEITKCEHTLTNITPDTYVKVLVCAVCTCPSRVLGKCAILNRYTCKPYNERVRSDHMSMFYIHLYMHVCTYMYILTHMLTYMYIHVVTVSLFIYQYFL